MNPPATVNFDQAEYKAALLKVLDMAREGHSFLLDGSLRLQVEVAKAYMWVSSIIVGIAMFVVKDIVLTPYSGIALIISLTLTCISFALSLLVLWGRRDGNHALIAPMNLATYVYDRFSNASAPYAEAISGLIGTIHDANATNCALNLGRKKMLRAAALFLFLSFLMLSTSIVLRLLHA